MPFRASGFERPALIAAFVIAIQVATCKSYNGDQKGVYLYGDPFP